MAIREVTNDDSKYYDLESELYFLFAEAIDLIFDPHTHDFYELIVINSGSLSMVLCEEKLELPEGSLLLVRPNDPHYNLEVPKNCKQLRLAIAPQIIDELFNFIYDNSIKEKFDSFKRLPVVHLSRHECEALYATVIQLSTLPYNRKRLIRSQVRALVTNLINQHYLKYLIRPLDDSLDNVSHYVPLWFSQLLWDMNSQQYLNYKLDDWAAKFGYTKEHICRCFSKYVGITFNKYVNNVRINCASNLLAHTSLSILDVSLECGFQSLSHFYHVFQATTNMTPLKFRQTHARWKEGIRIE